MKKIIVILALLFSTVSCSQNVDCSNFVEGKFYIPETNEVNEYYHIFRNSSLQLEINSKSDKNYYVVKWDKNCSYMLLPYPVEGNTVTKKIDSVKIEFVRIVGDTAYYNSTSYMDQKIFKYLGVKMIRTGDYPD